MGIGEGIDGPMAGDELGRAIAGRVQGGSARAAGGVEVVGVEERQLRVATSSETKVLRTEGAAYTSPMPCNRARNSASRASSCNRRRNSPPWKCHSVTWAPAREALGVCSWREKVVQVSWGRRGARTERMRPRTGGSGHGSHGCVAVGGEDGACRRAEDLDTLVARQVHPSWEKRRTSRRPMAEICAPRVQTMRPNACVSSRASSERPRRRIRSRAWRVSTAGRRTSGGWGARRSLACGAPRGVCDQMRGTQSESDASEPTGGPRAVCAGCSRGCGKEGEAGWSGPGGGRNSFSGSRPQSRSGRRPSSSCAGCGR